MSLTKLIVGVAAGIILASLVLTLLGYLYAGLIGPPNYHLVGQTESPEVAKRKVDSVFQKMNQDPATKERIQR